MKRKAFQRGGRVRRAMSPWGPCALAPLLACVLGTPQSVAAQCSEEPTILMDERTAESHLLSKKDLVLPADVPELAKVRTVVLLVTVDREGTICAVKPVLGPKELREAAVKTVKEHWRYRRFLLDWKPVVAQFPVTVKFALPKAEPRLTAMRRARPAEWGQSRAI